MLVYISTYLIAALILEVIRRNMNAPLFIRTRLKHFPWKLNYSCRWWGTDEYLAAITLSAFVLFLVLGIWIRLGIPIYKPYGWGLWAIICICSSVLSIRHFGLVRKFVANIWWLTLTAAVIAVGFGLFANALADAFIVNYTRIDAAQFPIAQKSLGMLMLVFCWIYSGTLLLSVVVIFAYFYANVMTPDSADPLKDICLPPQFGKGYRTGRSETRRKSMRLIVLSGSLFTVLSSWNFWDVVISHAEETVQETLVFASFHLHPRDCDIPGRPQGARAALISEGRVVVATPVSKGYVFETLKCKMQSIEQLQRQSSDRLKLDYYL
ncbi:MULTISPECIES: hypothetical protein [Pseudomonas]|jgi:F0F1-type ATP synthase membrane subunit c/vacuolar-type H+-ATPase subunit K|uniref:hypothetical protein n=1 Tax=Pseudomonas TaxID=286 RepID=UPI000F0710E7|nr:hypothetical protein [Pseudomonas atacamensis]MCI9873669.1 hypothetical protein [Pseudomonas atacamensis]